MTSIPYKNSGLSKKRQVEEMFDNISGKYDLLNHLLSGNIDKIWRKKAIKILEKYSPNSILDIATGTGDFAISASRIKPHKITGIDLSEKMLDIGRSKIEKAGLADLIELVKGDSEALPFNDCSFDAATVAFGVRNFENLEAGLAEILRVLNPSGVFIVLEFSQPRNRIFKRIYMFYLTVMLPRLAKVASGNEAAYHYLNESIRGFPYGDRFTGIMERLGFVNCNWIEQTFGIATIYISQKPKN